MNIYHCLCHTQDYYSVLTFSQQQNSGGMRSMSGPSGMMSNSLVGATGLDGGMGGMGGAGSGGMGNMHGLEGVDHLVYQTISMCKNKQGVGRDVLYSTLKGKAGPPQVE